MKITKNPKADLSTKDFTPEQWQIAELMQQNKIMKDSLKRQEIFMDCLTSADDGVEVEAWSSQRDRDTAQKLLRNILVHLYKQLSK